MSLGLGDLNKKKVSKAATTSTQKDFVAPARQDVQNEEKHPAGAWSRSSTTRPWRSSGMARVSKSQRRSIVDAAMNEEWLSLYTAPYFSFETAEHRLSVNDALKKIQELESLITEEFRSRLAALKHFARK